MHVCMYVSRGHVSPRPRTWSARKGTDGANFLNCIHLILERQPNKKINCVLFFCCSYVRTYASGNCAAGSHTHERLPFTEHSNKSYRKPNKNFHLKCNNYIQIRFEVAVKYMYVCINKDKNILPRSRHTHAHSHCTPRLCVCMPCLDHECASESTCLAIASQN